MGAVALLSRADSWLPRRGRALVLVLIALASVPTSAASLLVDVGKAAHRDATSYVYDSLGQSDVLLDGDAGGTAADQLVRAHTLDDPSAAYIYDDPSNVARADARPGAYRSAPNTALSGTARARQLGSQGELAAGIDPTVVKTRIPSLTNSTRSGYRVPDELTDVSLREVKNVQRLGFTPQIQDFTYYASQNGLRFDLVVRRNTVLTRELDDIVNMTGSPINLVRML